MTVFGVKPSSQRADHCSMLKQSDDGKMTTSCEWVKKYFQHLAILWHSFRKDLVHSQYEDCMLEYLDMEEFGRILWQGGQRALQYSYRPTLACA